MNIKKRASADAFKKERMAWAKVKQTKPVRDRKYLAWIRLQWCVICEHVTGSEAGTRHIEAAHSGPHGISQKASDWDAIPLCVRHHRTGRDSYHVLGRKFFAHHGMKREVIIAACRRGYEHAGYHRGCEV
jgi:hypothetical protein